jgi:hypothetical protein
MRYVLIHGYGVGGEYWQFRKPEGKFAGFGAFSELINHEEAGVFRWDEPRQFSFWELFNPFEHLKLYDREKAKSQSSNTHKNLKTFLYQENPEVIVCHSMGCSLLLNYLDTNPLPNSVRHIVFVQGNTSQSRKLPESLQTQLVSKHLHLTNLFCPWDQALWSLVLTKHVVPAGLFGFNNPFVQNRLFPLYRRLNLHTSSINDPNLFSILDAR